MGVQGNEIPNRINLFGLFRLSCNAFHLVWIHRDRNPLVARGMRHLRDGPICRQRYGGRVCAQCHPAAYGMTSPHFDFVYNRCPAPRAFTAGDALSG